MKLASEIRESFATKKTKNKNKTQEHQRNKQQICFNSINYIKLIFPFSFLILASLLY
jgi:hypothetical protein